MNGISRIPASNIHTLPDVHSLMRIRCSRGKPKKKKKPRHTESQHLYQTITTHQQLLFPLQFIQSCLQLRNVRVKTLWCRLQGLDLVLSNIPHKGRGSICQPFLTPSKSKMASLKQKHEKKILEKILSKEHSAPQSERRDSQRRPRMDMTKHRRKGWTWIGRSACGFSSNTVTYVDVFRQHLVRHSVFLEDVIVYGCSGHDGSEEEAE